MSTRAPLYGPQQSRFARYLERREQRKPDLEARELRRRALAGLHGRVIEVGFGDGRSFEHYPAEVERVLAVEPDPTARVLVPGGELRFWEHVRSNNPAFRTLQRACDALFWTRALGGCETTRDTVSAIRDAGFRLVRPDRGFHSSSLLTHDGAVRARSRG
jgi:hypothetical protein